MNRIMVDFVAICAMVDFQDFASPDMPTYHIVVFKLLVA